MLAEATPAAQISGADDEPFTCVFTLHRNRYIKWSTLMGILYDIFSLIVIPT